MGILDNILKANRLNPDDFKEPDDISDIKRLKGKVVKINTDKGWGFIVSDELKFTRIFFHWRALGSFAISELKKYDLVEFTPIKDEEQGWRAVKIKVLR